MQRKRLTATNREFAATNTIFRLACTMAAVDPTTRQASKFRMNRGKAHGFETAAIRKLTEEYSPNGR